MAVSTKQSTILLIEFTDSAGNEALNWRIDNPVNNLSRQQVTTACNTLFAANNTCGYDILKGNSGLVAVSVGKVQTVETNIVTTDLT